MKDIIELAREAGFPERRAFSDLSDLYPRLERFAALVRAAALAEQPAEQDPVAWLMRSGKARWVEFENPVSGSALPPGTTMRPLVFGDTAPHPRREVELTDEEIMELTQGECQDMRWPSTATHVARAVIEAYKAKQEGGAA